MKCRNGKKFRRIKTKPRNIAKKIRKQNTRAEYQSSANWKNLHSLSERLATLGIMGPQFRDLLQPLKTIVPWCTEGFRGAFNCASMMPRDSTLVRLIAVVFPAWFRQSGAVDCTIPPTSSIYLFCLGKHMQMTSFFFSYIQASRE